MKIEASSEDTPKSMPCRWRVMSAAPRHPNPVPAAVNTALLASTSFIT